MTGEYTQSIGKKINARVSMDDSGLKIKVNFFAPIHQLSKIKSDLTKKIYESINKDKKVELAYPRREITIKKG
ncbi:hypothetical protein HYW75_03835 [Candidatus Pacearchaeota archaeon]|nr:hypothetical protein [Candidatus Pacearchaeota archaeon]